MTYASQPQSMYDGQSVRSYKDSSNKFGLLGPFVLGVFAGAVFSSSFRKDQTRNLEDKL